MPKSIMTKELKFNKPGSDEREESPQPIGLGDLNNLWESQISNILEAMPSDVTPKNKPILSNHHQIIAQSDSLGVDDGLSIFISRIKIY